MHDFSALNCAAAVMRLCFSLFFHRAADKHCCAVAEGDLGTFVYCTSDGGATWNATYNNPDPNSSLIDIAALSPTEYWACGMEAGTFGPTAGELE